MYPHVIHPMAGFGAAVPLLHLNLNPAFQPCITPVSKGGQGGKWVGDQATGSCQVGGGIPTWAYVAGGVAIVGAAAYYFMGK